MISDIQAAVQSVREEATQFLCELIRYPSLPGQEAGVMRHASLRFAELGSVEHVALSNELRQDVDYSNPLPDIEYEGRYNLRVRVPGTGKGRTLLLNAHLDVVPASEGQDRPFDPVVRDGIVYGRGACDDKGQAATIFAALSAIARLGYAFRGDIIIHLVNEEEVGGNGTLAMIRRGEVADGCIVLEPTDLKIGCSNRGAVWFRVICTGKPGHSGQAQGPVSALKMATRVIEILEQYQARLLESSRGIAFFDDHPNPMPITFGKLNAGNWPATAPAHAVIEGVLGFLPNKTRFQIMQEMREAIREAGDPWLKENFTLEFMYRHDAQVLAPTHPLVSELQVACREAGSGDNVAAITASSDSWYYGNQLEIPTLVFGPGSLSDAHSNHEQVRMDEVCRAAVILVRFCERWCGKA